MELDKLKPERVMTYFRQLSGIPRGSGHTEKVTAWLLDFAEQKGLDAEADDAGNVLIRKKAGKGCESAPAVILQGHSDMICEKRAGVSHSFETDPLELETDGRFLRARGTTLGADDGIAVAMILAILEDDTLRHPELEAVITTDEEVGMLGAKAFRYEKLNGRLMLNLDSEEEGVLTAGCAGGVSLRMRFPVKRENVRTGLMSIRIDHLKGGHSGNEIDRGRINAALLAGRILKELSGKVPVRICAFSSGRKDNAIPREAELVIGVSEDRMPEVRARLEDLQDAVRKEYAGIEEKPAISVAAWERDVPAGVLTEDSAKRILDFLYLVPDGVRRMSGQIPGLVQTSSNLGIFNLRESYAEIVCSVRSGILSARNDLAKRIRLLAQRCGAVWIQEEGAYDPWEFQQDCPFRDLAAGVWKELTGKPAKVDVIHAGLECGLFVNALPGLQCISMGPDIHAIHTTEEALDLGSANRVYAAVRLILERIADTGVR